MGATFKQDIINVRERLDALEAAPALIGNNAQAIELLKSYSGKNLYINAAKSIAQRGVFSPAVPIVSSTVYVDRFGVTINAVTGTVEHIQDPEGIAGPSVRYEVTGAATGWITHQQRIEHYEPHSGHYVTYTAQVKSNIPVNLYISDGVISGFSSKHTGSGFLEVLSVTMLVSEGGDRLNGTVSNYDGAATVLDTGDYFEVGNEMFEAGEHFTGFEQDDPTINDIQCKRYYERINAEDGYLYFASGQAIDTTKAVASINYAVSKRIVPTITFSGAFCWLDASGAFIPVGLLQSPRTSKHSANIVDSSTSGLIAGNGTMLSANNDTSAYIEVDAEML